MTETNSLAIVHEWLTTFGGSERLLTQILKIYPNASLHTLLHHAPSFQRTPLAGRKVNTSFLQRLPYVHKYYRYLLPLMPLAIKGLNVRGQRVVLSISHAVAHAVPTAEGQTHIAYVCTPMRYAWHLEDNYLHAHRLNGSVTGWLARTLLGQMRAWDYRAAQRENHLLAISHWTASQIERYWKREAQVIYPPVDVDRFEPAEERDRFYLFVSRLVPYKMAYEIVEGFNRLGLPLVIVGEGPETKRISKMAGSNVSMLGHQPDSVVTDLMNRAKAFVYMAIEDFGIAMVEAQAAGCPVIAYGRGGAAEIVREGETGLLYREQTRESMMEAVGRFESRTSGFNRLAARQNAMRFSTARFREEFRSFIKPFFGD
ncbi:MAG: glycosyltransferase family 4 protein [Anaerolineales bacterium]